MRKWRSIFSQRLIWKPRINIIFDKDQTNYQKQLKLEIAAIFLKKLSGRDHD